MNDRKLRWHIRANGSEKLLDFWKGYRAAEASSAAEISRIRTEVERLKVCRGVKEWRRLMNELCGYELDYQAARQREAELVEALIGAIKIAHEARIEWDKAPSGMKAGKLLIALSGNLPGYRADIDKIHAALLSKQQEPSRDQLMSERGAYEQQGNTDGK